MLVADNRAYDYKDEQYIYDIPLCDEKKKPIKKKIKKQKSKSQIFTVIFVFSISILMIARYAYIAEISFNINMLEKELKEIQKDNSLLNVKLAQTINLQSLEKVAFEELNMQYPDSEQIVYVNVEKLLQKNDITDKTYLSKKDVFENKYVAKVKSIISIFISYLD